MLSDVVIGCLMLPCVALCWRMLAYVLKHSLATRVMVGLMLSCVALCCLKLSYVGVCIRTSVDHTWVVLPYGVLCYIMVFLCCPMLSYVVLC